MPWFAKHGYKTLKFPDGVSEDSTDEEIDTAVHAEYSESEYEKFKEFIESKCGEFSDNLEKLKAVPSLVLRDVYTIVLTKYGVGGSYNAEKGLTIVNLSRGDKESMIGIIFHEIVHMAIEHLIQKYKIQQWHKERLVDLMMDKYFPGLTEKQNIKEDVSAVDEAFNNFFPDIEAIVNAINRGYQH